MMHTYVKETISDAKLAKGKGNGNEVFHCNNCFPFTLWMSKINITQIYNSKGIDVVMPTYLI